MVTVFVHVVLKIGWGYFVQCSICNIYVDFSLFVHYCCFFFLHIVSSCVVRTSLDCLGMWNFILLGTEARSCSPPPPPNYTWIHQFAPLVRGSLALPFPSSQLHLDPSVRTTSERLVHAPLPLLPITPGSISFCSV